MCRLYNVWLDDISVVKLLWDRKILSMYHTFAHLIIKSDLKLFMEYCFCYKIKGEKKLNKRKEYTNYEYESI